MQRPVALSRLLMGELGQEITHGHHVTKLFSSWDCGFTMHRVRLAAGAVQLLTSSDSADGQAVKAKPPREEGLSWDSCSLPTLNGQWVLLFQAAHLIPVHLSSQVRLLCLEEEVSMLDECPSPHLPHPSTTGIGMSSVSRRLIQRGFN